MKNYFKKFSIMLVMALCLFSIGIGNKVFASAVSWNPNDKGTGIVLSNDNLTATLNGSHTNSNVRSNIFVTSGKRYCELKVNNLSGTIMFGVANDKFAINNDFFNSSNQLSYYSYNGSIYPSTSSYGSGYGASDVIGMAIDIDNKKIKFSRNGTWYKDMDLPTWDKYYVHLGSGSSSNNNNSTTNFGATPFVYNIPTGYLPFDNGSGSTILLNKSSLDLLVDNSEQLTAATTPAGAQVTWKSSDESIATVDSNGKVTGIKEGQATIAATTTNGLTATCTVNVTEEAIIVNTARAKGDNTNNASGSVSIIFKGVAESQLSVVKTADVDSVYVGDTFTYTIVVTNTSSKTAKAVVVNDSAPNHIDFNVGGITTTQGKIDSSSTSKNIMVNVGDIPPSGTVTIKIPVTVIS